ncbi:XVIPCD domain-containing protein [Xanthomonas albilineans]|uniref:XVIPCD domain-containing protein n=1 Tax=Xanthomonas albilineans TaxID=29447 RepID=UPI003CCCF0E8
MALNARERGLTRVDHLHFNADKGGIVAEQKSNGFGMSHQFSGTNIQHAMQTLPALGHSALRRWSVMRACRR